MGKKANKRYEALAKDKSRSRSGSEGKASGSVLSPESFTEADNMLGLWSPRSGASRYATPESMTKVVLPSIEDQALGFFIANHVSLPALVPRGQYEWILEAMHGAGSEDVLRYSVNAACLAGLANSTKNTVIMSKAQAAYSTALRMTNSALLDTKTAVKDSTLISVIMLGLYENFVFHDERSIKAWAAHVRGASALLVLRGTQQFESDFARRIFHQFFGTILLVSLESGSAIPDGIRELYDYCNPTSNYTVQGRQWTTRLAQFLHDSIDLNKDQHSDPIHMINKAINLDQEFNDINTLMSDIWKFKVIVLKNSSEYVYGSSYHSYIDPWFAQMWNNLRLCRMHLYRLVIKQTWKGRGYFPPLFSHEEAESQLDAARQIIQGITADVCASVPQLTGMTAFPRISTPSAARSPTKAQSPPGAVDLDDDQDQIHPPGTFLDAAKSTGMHHLIWPLYAAGLSDTSSVEMRQYAIDMLYFIALRIGTLQAVVLANNLKEMQMPTPRRQGFVVPVHNLPSPP